jgi:hypothetical protein
MERPIEQSTSMSLDPRNSIKHTVKREQSLSFLSFSISSILIDVILPGLVAVAVVAVAVVAVEEFAVVDVLKKLE